MIHGVQTTVIKTEDVQRICNNYNVDNMRVSLYRFSSTYRIQRQGSDSCRQQACQHVVTANKISIASPGNINNLPTKLKDFLSSQHTLWSTE